MKNEAPGSWAKWKVRGRLTPEKFLEDSLIRPLSLLLLLPAPIPAMLRVLCFYNRYFTLCVALTWGIGERLTDWKLSAFDPGSVGTSAKPCIAVPRLNLCTTFLQNVLERSLFYKQSNWCTQTNIQKAHKLFHSLAFDSTSSTRYDLFQRHILNRVHLQVKAILERPVF